MRSEFSIIHRISMEARDLLRNIKSDFISEVLPFMRMQPANPTQVTQLYSQFQALNTLFSAETYRTCTKIATSNVFEFVYIRQFGAPSAFEDYMLLRFASSTLSSSLTSAVFRTNLNAWGLFIRPLIDGAFTVGALMLRHPAETRRMFTTSFPGVTQFILEDCNGQAVLDLVDAVQTIIAQPRIEQI
jgi:hypothetical protein